MEGFGERNEKEEMIQLKTSKCNKIFKIKDIILFLCWVLSGLRIRVTVAS